MEWIDTELKASDANTITVETCGKRNTIITNGRWPYRIHRRLYKQLFKAIVETYAIIGYKVDAIEHKWIISW